jgi:urea transporter
MMTGIQSVDRILKHPVTRNILNSYSQVFFSHNKVFAAILLAVTFFDVVAGASGLLSVLIAGLLGYFAGFNRSNIGNGYYGFNNLLVGLGLGIYYQPSAEFVLILVISAILTFFFTIMLEGVIGKYGLPYLSVPFLFGLWLVTLASRSYTQLELSERGIYSLNEMYLLGGHSLVATYEWFNNLGLPEAIKVYFRSLGAIFFQYHLFPGILIAAGLLIYSRIGFTLSLLGFFSAFLFYRLVGANISELSYAYIGFNYILTSIAVGGFFIIPSRSSYLWVIVLTPVISIILSATSALFMPVQLSIYSLPFNIVVLVFLYALKFREKQGLRPELTAYQHHSPEKNIYYHTNFRERFGSQLHTSLSLPFWGEWRVTQGHSGKITHMDNWQHAWDFEIFDEEGRKFRGSGKKPGDYYCYEKPVVAPADGQVEKILDGVEDNPIGDMDIRQNWGNSIVIKHHEHLFTQLSHLKKDSFKVKEGDHVKRGDILGLCGNSGRSPVPHLHFQVQETPQIGSRTMDYPISRYISRGHDQEFFFKSNDIPSEKEPVRNIEKNSNIENAFRFIPGQKLCYEVNGRGKKSVADWEVRTDIYNNAWLHCLETGARAFFRRDDDLFRFTFYQGRRDAFLYQFYLAFYKVGFGFYKGLKIEDSIPLPEISRPSRRILQDFLAPFLTFMKGRYRLNYESIKGQFDEHTIVLKSEAVRLVFGRKSFAREFKIVIRGRLIEKIEVIQNGEVNHIAACEE